MPIDVTGRRLSLNLDVCADPLEECGRKFSLGLIVKFGMEESMVLLGAC